MGGKRVIKTLVLLISTLLFLAISANADENWPQDQDALASGESYSSSETRIQRDSPPKYGQKLRKKPRKLEVDGLELPSRTEEYSQSQEYSEVPSSTLPPVKTKHGRVPSKVMVRTHKSTTSTPHYEQQQQQEHQNYDHQELSTTTTESPLPAWSRYYQSPYISRKPSIPPKKYVFSTHQGGKKVSTTQQQHTSSSSRGTTPFRRITTTTTTTTTTLPPPTESSFHQFTFPPYSPVGVDEAHGATHPHVDVDTDAPAQVEESRTLSRTLETPPPPQRVFAPPPPPPQQRVVSRGKISSSVKLVSGGGRRPQSHIPVVSTTRVTSTSTSTSTEPPPPTEENTTYYPNVNHVHENSGDPGINTSFETNASGEQQDFETTFYYSPSTPVSTSARTTPTSATTPERPRTTVTTASTTTTTTRQTQAPTPVVQQNHPSQIKPVREFITLSHQSVKGIPLRVTTKTFKPIYRVVTQVDAADPNERKPELDLVTATPKTVTTPQQPTVSMSFSSSSSSSSASDEDVSGETTIPVTSTSTVSSTPSSTTAVVNVNESSPSPSSTPEETNGQDPPAGLVNDNDDSTLPPLIPQSSSNTSNKNKVHYIITVIDPPKKGNSSSSSGSTKTSVDLGEKTEEFEEEADEDDFPFADFLTTPATPKNHNPNPNQDQNHQLIPVVSEDNAGSDQDSHSHLQLLERFKSLNIPAPDFINEAINSPNFLPSGPSSPGGGGREEQIFHFSSDRPYQHIAPSGPSQYTGNFVVEEPSFGNKQASQNGNNNNVNINNGHIVYQQSPKSRDSFKSQFIQSIPLRTVVTYQPEPSDPSGSDLFTAKSVAFYTQLGPDGKITKQLLKAPNNGNNPNGHELSFDNVPQFLSRFQADSAESHARIVREERDGGGSGGGGLIDKAVPAQSYYLEQVGRQRQQQQGRIRDDGQDNLRTVPFTVDLVPI